MTAKQVLEMGGIEFPEGASAIFNAQTSTLIIRNTEDQFELIDAFLQTLGPGDAELQIHLIMEYIEVDHDLFSEWLFDNRLTSDGTPLRIEVQKWVKGGKATIIETALITARSGQRAKTEAITEFIYPTEMDPPEIPNTVTLSGDAKAPQTGVNPTAFETRNLGLTLEVDPVLGADNSTVDLNLSPEIVKHIGFGTWPSEDSDPFSKIQMPTMYTQKISTQVTVTDGNYAFLGTTRPDKPADPKVTDNPIVLQFVRPDVAKVKAWGGVEEIKVENGNKK
ncbi:MAG: hypothetical protein HKN23_00185 [Verrucomicrobiales bacterium]|nr:hypothetical protein [Verrucomicrobiales bacterium]